MIIGIAVGSVVFVIFVLGVILLLITNLIIKPSPRLEDYRLSDFNLPVEDVEFESPDRIKLSGWFIKGKSQSVVILCHGYAKSREELLPQADILYKAGYSILMFDFRNRGKSQGSFVTLGIKEPLDILGAVDYLKTRDDVNPVRDYRGQRERQREQISNWVNPNRIGGLGISQGAVSLIGAAATTQDIKALVVESAFASLRDTMDRNFYRRIHLPAFPFFRILSFIVKLRLKIKDDEIDVAKLVRKMNRRPILFIHDSKDETISPDSGKLLFEAAKGPKELWLVPEAGHVQALKTRPKEYQKKVLGFFLNNLPL